jgi:hypothetical protein
MWTVKGIIVLSLVAGEWRVLDLDRHIRDAWAEGVKHGHEIVIANVRRTALHRRDDATLCVCMTCGITWREDGFAAVPFAANRVPPTLA